MNFATTIGTGNYLVTPTAYQAQVCSIANNGTYTMTTATTTTWQAWVVDSSHYTQSVVFNNWYAEVSAEQLAEQARRQEQEQLWEYKERLRRAEEEAKKREEERKRAAVKAKALLLSLLDEEQEKQYVSSGCFELRTDARHYRINPGARVEELDPAGKVVARFCIHPPDYEMPREDWAIAQKLMLETDEETFHRVANRRAA